MSFKRLFQDKYAGSSPENASVVRTLFDLFFPFSSLWDRTITLFLSFVQYYQWSHHRSCLWGCQVTLQKTIALVVAQFQTGVLQTPLSFNADDSPSLSHLGQVGRVGHRTTQDTTITTTITGIWHQMTHWHSLKWWSHSLCLRSHRAQQKPCWFRRQ